MTLGIVWLIAIIIIPAILIYRLKVNGALVFLALCLGYVLFTFDAHQARSIATPKIIPHIKSSSMIIDLALLLLPAIITLVLRIGSVHGKQKYLNIVPALSVGFLTAFLVVPVLPSSVIVSVISTSIWTKLEHLQSTIVGIGALVSMVYFWSSLHKDRHSKKSHEHHAKE